MVNLRGLAAQVISEVLEQHRSLSDVMPRYKKKCKNNEDASLLQAITFGVLRFYPRFEFIAEKLLKKPFKSKDNIVLYLIIIGIYQLADLRIPDYATLSETVEACRQLNKPWATAVVNATLRKFQKDPQDFLRQTQENRLAWYAHPTWLLNHIKSAWPEHWEYILEENNNPAPLVLRINQKMCQREEYLAKLTEQGINAQPINVISSAIQLDVPMDVTQLPGYDAGLFSVQDAASQSVAFLLDLKPHLKILDACAAPGGKTGHILELMPTAEVVAVDIAKERTDKIAENLRRLQLSATILTEDIRNIAKHFSNHSFDRILLDAPCSAIGVIRRHPDIKYLRRAQDIPALAAQQLKLLQTVWPLLKPDGILLYTTCSILPEENQHIVKEFMKERSDATIFPIMLPYGVPVAMGHQILPGQNGMDGFYYARIRKKKA